MKALKRLVVTFVALVLLCVVIGLFLPNTWEVQASIVIDAPSERIHPYIDSPKRWVREIGDVTAARMETDVSSYNYTFNDVESGAGAGWSWVSDMDKGRIKWTKTDPQAGVWYESAIMTDEVNGGGSIVYEKVDGGTKVTWNDRGETWPVVGGYMKGAIEGALSEYFNEMLKTLKTTVEADDGGAPEDAPAADPPPDDG